MARMAKPTLYLMLGYPGAGKTTTAKIIQELTGATRLSSDEERLKLFPQPTFTEAEHKVLYDMLDHKAERLLKEGTSVIYDSNLNRYIHRQQKYDITERTGARPVLVWVRADIDLARKRATEQSDNNDQRPFGNLQPPVFERLVREIEPPRENEPAVIMDGTNVTKETVKQLLGL